MFINYVALMLINLVASLVLVAAFVWFGLDNEPVVERADRSGRMAPEGRIALGGHRRWAPGFTVAGLIMTVTGFHMIFNWPLPGSFNIAYGESSVLLGTLMLGTALALYLGWDLLPLAIVAFFAGLDAVVIGLGIISNAMGRAPLPAGIGFILPGLAGILAVPVYLWRSSRIVRLIAVLALLVAAAIFAYTGYMSTWGHLQDYSGWVPATIRAAQAAGGGGGE